MNSLPLTQALLTPVNFHYLISKVLLFSGSKLRFENENSSISSAVEMAQSIYRAANDLF